MNKYTVLFICVAVWFAGGFFGYMAADKDVEIVEKDQRDCPDVRIEYNLSDNTSHRWRMGEASNLCVLIEERWLVGKHGGSYAFQYFPSPKKALESMNNTEEYRKSIGESPYHTKAKGFLGLYSLVKLPVVSEKRESTIEYLRHTISAPNRNGR